MKIAIPSDNGQNISTHFGRCYYFIIYQISDNKVIDRIVRDNVCCPHRLGICPKATPNKDQKIVEKIRESALTEIRDCHLLIGRYINPILKKTLEKYNIDFRVVDEKDADETIAKYLIGALVDKSVYFPCEQSQCKLSCLEKLDDKDAS